MDYEVTGGDLPSLLFPLKRSQGLLPPPKAVSPPTTEEPSLWGAFGCDPLLPPSKRSRGELQVTGADWGWVAPHAATQHFIQQTELQKTIDSSAMML